MPSESVVKDLCRKIRQSVADEAWSRYEEQNTDRGRLQVFLNKKEIQSCVEKNLELHPSQKDKAKAMILKNAGNKAFGSGDNEGALYLYTQCLAWMPHDDGTKDAAIVYANRSAALFHMEEYWLAMKDAELAFSMNYPNELHYKLHERHGRCCLQTGNNPEANKSFLAAINALQYAALDELKMKKTRRLLEELVKSSSSALHGFVQNQDKSRSGTGGSQKSECRLPDIAGGPGKYLRNASSRLSLQYRENQGRFVVASEGFRPGDVILVEKPFVSVLNPEQYHRQCHQCYAPLQAPIMCEKCIHTSFCSTACRKAARNYHQYECGLLGLLKHSGVSVICYMALRIFTKSGPKELLKWFELAEKTEQSESRKVSQESGNNWRDKSATLETLGFNEEYRTDYVALFHLVTHSKLRRHEDFFHQIVMSLYLLEALKKTSFFYSLDDFVAGNGGRKETSVPNGKEDEQQRAKTLEKNGQNEAGGPAEGNELACGGAMQQQDNNNLPGGEDLELKFAVLMLRFLKCLQFNTHETAGWNPELEKDHSVSYGGVVARAIKTISPGEQVFENYGPSSSTTPKDERQKSLMEVYRFQCDCIACREDWPLFENMSSDCLKFRCQNCRTYICKVDENMGILFRCGKCGKNVNILQCLKSLHESEKKYKQAVEFINEGQMDTGLGMLLENLYLLESNLVPPFKEFHMCQEYIRRCYLHMGNRTSQLKFWEPEKLPLL